MKTNEKNFDEMLEKVNGAIADAIANSVDDSEGKFSVEVEVDGIIISAEGSYEVDGYREDDYYNGTGAYIVTKAEVEIDDIQAYDEDGNKADVPCEWYEIERMAEDRLSA